MKKFDAVIVGSGLGGMISAYILSKEGYNICLLEKHYQIGGSMQNFKRDGLSFDTGAHYVGGMDEGQNLYRYFKYFNLIGKLNIKKMDVDGFDHICFGDNQKTYKYAMGYERFKDTLLSDFPNDYKVLDGYTKKLIEISNAFPLYKLRDSSQSILETEYFKDSTNQFLDQLTDDNRLKNVLAGTNLLYAGEIYKTPLYIHSLINNSYIESAYRFVDGSSQVINHLADSIISNGGTIIKNAEVNKFEIIDKSISCVNLTNGEKIYADKFISNIHPSVTLGMIDKDKMRKVYRDRINNLENTISVFTLYITLKENSFKYMNHNTYYYKYNNVWTASSYNADDWPESYLLLTQPSSNGSVYAKGITVMAYMKYDEVKKWENTKIEQRGAEYDEFKERKTQQLLSLIEEKYPDIRQHIKNVYSSTPLTYKDYTSTKDGALYGVLRDCNEPIKSIILPKTKIPNLFLTGQNINLHGVLGVTIGAVLTCSEILGHSYLLAKIKEAQ